MTSYPFFKSTKEQEELDANGFVKIPFLQEEELEALRAFYSEMHPDLEPPEKIDGIHMTTWCSDPGYKEKVQQRLAAIYKAPINRIFQDYRALNNVFIVKESGKGTSFKVHQDWNVVDESKFAAVNVWVPLYDVDENTGALWMLKNSHKLDRHIRGSAYLFPNYSPFFDELEKAATSVALKAGEAIVFYVNAIHGSPPNLGETPRIASCFSLVPEEAPLHIYFQKEEGAPLEVHAPEDDFMYQYKSLRTETFERPPTDSPVEILPSYVNHAIQLKELKPFLKAKRRWWSFKS